MFTLKIACSRVSREFSVWDSYQKVWRLWQQPCGRHGWIDTEYILYKDGIVALIVGNFNNLPLNSDILDAAFSDYGNGLAFKQNYTSLHGMWKTDYFWPVLNQHFLY